MSARFLSSLSLGKLSRLSGVRWISTVLNYDGEFEKPDMKTAVPGPKSKVRVQLCFVAIIIVIPHFQELHSDLKDVKVH